MSSFRNDVFISDYLTMDEVQKSSNTKGTGYYSLAARDSEVRELLA
jgi:hypothetical protein